MQHTNLNEFCTYLTIYSGSKLPPFYIGSTTVANIADGYHGSVSSKKYKKIWKDELHVNPQLFNTRIISRHSTREDALVKELFFQVSLKVVKSSMYINLSTAQKDGCFGAGLSGKDHPHFGKTLSEDRKRQNRDYRHTETARKRISETHTGSGHPLYGKKHKLESKEKMSKSHKGKIISEETKIKLREAHKGRVYNKWDITEDIREAISKERKERLWWNNGVINKMCKECPDGGGNWARGRIKRDKTINGA